MKTIKTVSFFFPFLITYGISRGLIIKTIVSKCFNSISFHSKSRMIRLLNFVLMISFLISCAASSTSIYDLDYPLTNEIARSKTSIMYVKIPQGWFVADDNECNCIDLWLVKEDYSATINFITINIDSATSQKIKENKLESITAISKTFIKAKYGKNFKGFFNEELFSIRKNKFSAYQYVNENQQTVRVVLFIYDGKFYEVKAIHVKTDNPLEVFKVQNSVLSSIK